MSRPGEKYSRPLPDGWLTTEEAAERIGVTPAYIVQLLHTWPKEITAKRYTDPAGKLTKFWILDAWSLDEYALAHGRPRKVKTHKKPPSRQQSLWGEDMSPDGYIKGRKSAAPLEMARLPAEDVWMTRAAAAAALGICLSGLRRMQRQGRFALTLCVRGLWYIARSSIEQVKHEELVGLRRRLEQG